MQRVGVREDEGNGAWNLNWMHIFNSDHGNNKMSSILEKLELQNSPYTKYWWKTMFADCRSRQQLRESLQWRWVNITVNVINWKENNCLSSCKANNGPSAMVNFDGFKMQKERRWMRTGMVINTGGEPEVD